LMPIFTFSLVPVVLTGTMTAEARAAREVRRAGAAAGARREADAGARARAGEAVVRTGRAEARGAPVRINLRRGEEGERRGVAADRPRGRGGAAEMEP